MLARDRNWIPQSAADADAAVEAWTNRKIGALRRERGLDEAVSPATESGEVPCDGKTYGTGIVTSSGRKLPMRLRYDIAADFRIVVALIAP